MRTLRLSPFLGQCAFCSAIYPNPNKRTGNQADSSYYEKQSIHTVIAPFQDLRGVTVVNYYSVA